MATVHAYLSYSRLRPADLLDMDQQKLVDVLSFTSLADMGTGDRWIHVGTAEVTVSLDSHEQIMAHTIACLRQKQGELQAAATKIEGEIQKLLAITCGAA